MLDGKGIIAIVVVIVSNDPKPLSSSQSYQFAALWTVAISITLLLIVIHQPSLSAEDLNDVSFSQHHFTNAFRFSFIFQRRRFNAIGPFYIPFGPHGCTDILKVGFFPRRRFKLAARLVA